MIDDSNEKTSTKQFLVEAISRKPDKDVFSANEPHHSAHL